MEINFKAPMRLVRHLAPGMVQKVRRSCMRRTASKLLSPMINPHRRLPPAIPRAMASLSTWAMSRPLIPAPTSGSPSLALCLLCNYLANRVD